MIHLLYIFLQTQSPNTGQQPQDMDYTFFIFMGGIFLVMYFFFMRPQMKKQKQEKSFQEELKKGQRIVTNSGLHGKINEISDTTLVLETSAGKLTYERSSVSRDLTYARFPEYGEVKTK